MINATDIHSITDFQRNVKAHLKHLKETGRPEVLTVNGQAALIVQDAASYQRLLDLVERAESVDGIQRGLNDIKHGRTQPMRAVVAELGQQYEKVRR